MTRRITPQTTLDNLKKEAKRWLKELRANDTGALERLQRALTTPPKDPVLRDIQHALAVEYGLANWKALKDAVAASPAESAPDPVAKYESVADDVVTVYDTGDVSALERINDHFRRHFSVEDLRATVWRLVYKVRQAGGAASAFGGAEARELISRVQGFANWTELIETVAKGGPPPVPAYALDMRANRIMARRNVTISEWEAIAGVIKEHGITMLEASGFMTDEVIPHIAALEQLTALRLGGSRGLTDEGLQHLAKMPQLEQLDLSEYPGGVLTDRGLEVLRHLPNLRSFQMTWQRGITDAGVANLKYCDKIESVQLMGSPTGDGAVEVLRGKPNLWRFESGRLVTDAGLAMLQDFPMFRTWHGEAPAGAPGRDEGVPTRLLIDGPFTNGGLAGLAGLEGVASLDLFWHVNGITTDAFEVLRTMLNLRVLGCDGALSDDRAMAHIAAIPQLLRLRAQGSTATDDGFIALSKSATLERFWGREAPNLTGRGFRAFAAMPSLRSLGVSLKQVDDAALSLLPEFPQLRQLTPIDVLDDGFQHVGACPRLEDLSCMYCRESGDIATSHIERLPLKKYYAGLTQITDRSLEVLGRMGSLEEIEFYETKRVTDAGLPHLTRLPKLREVHFSGLPLVTFAGTKVFPAGVRVEYNT